MILYYRTFNMPAKLDNVNPVKIPVLMLSCQSAVALDPKQKNRPSDVESARSVTHIIWIV